VASTTDSIQEAVRQLTEAERLLLAAMGHLGAADDLLSDPAKKEPLEAGIEGLNVIHHVHDHPMKIKLERTKGGYKWEVHVSGSDLEEVLSKIEEADQQLIAGYGGI